jgi:hypothetical protein
VTGQIMEPAVLVLRPGSPGKDESVIYRSQHHHAIRLRMPTCRSEPRKAAGQRRTNNLRASRTRICLQSERKYSALGASVWLSP